MQNNLRMPNPPAKKWKKRLFIILCFIAFSVLAVKCTFDKVMRDGYGIVLTGWGDTPEEAIIKDMASAAWYDWELKEIIAVKHESEKMAQVLYVTDANTLVSQHCYKYDKGWLVSSTSDPEYLESPEEFVLNGDPEQFIQNPISFFYEDNYVSGWKLSSAPNILIDGILAQTETYTVTINGKEWSIDYWWVENIELSYDYDPKLEYESESSVD